VGVRGRPRRVDDAARAGREEPGALPRRREAVSWRVMASASGLFLVALGYGAGTSYAALLATETGITPRRLYFTVFALTVIGTRLLLPGIADRSSAERVLVPSFLLVPP